MDLRDEVHHCVRSVGVVSRVRIVQRALEAVMRRSAIRAVNPGTSRWSAVCERGRRPVRSHGGLRVKNAQRLRLLADRCELSVFSSGDLLQVSTRRICGVIIVLGVDDPRQLRGTCARGYVVCAESWESE